MNPSLAEPLRRHSRACMTQSRSKRRQANAIMFSVKTERSSASGPKCPKCSTRTLPGWAKANDKPVNESVEVGCKRRATTLGDGEGK